MYSGAHGRHGPHEKGERIRGEGGAVAAISCSSPRPGAKGKDYLGWMTANVDALADALDK
ncbi:hypothetical protein SALBM311S_02847 [Streptomyces alboniger]